MSLISSYLIQSDLISSELSVPIGLVVRRECEGDSVRCGCDQSLSINGLFDLAA